MVVRVFLFLGFFLAAAPVAAGEPVVLFDQGHGQRFLVERSDPLGLATLAGLFTERGNSVRSNATPLNDAALAEIDILVISGAFAPLTAAELDAVDRFLARGGRLAVMLHIGPTLAGLLERLGVVHSNGVIRDAEHTVDGNPLNFRATRFAQHPLVDGLKWFNLYGAWALSAERPPALEIAGSSPHSWVDLNGDKQLGQGDAVQSFGVLVAGEKGPGRFAVFGDDALFQNQFLLGENLTLARNLVRWLQP